MKILQANTTPYKGESLSLYVVGARLRYLGPDPEESVIAEYFRPGDVLVVEAKNGCGMGIDVKCDRNGVFDIVWATEVELIGKKSKGLPRLTPSQKYVLRLLLRWGQTYTSKKTSKGDVSGSCAAALIRKGLVERNRDQVQLTSYGTEVAKLLAEVIGQ